eukprot:Clim_evm22s166 gene=Clim_evmTU22s166
MEDRLVCSLARWYPHLQKHTIPTRFLKLPRDVVEFILSDGIVLPPKLSKHIAYEHAGNVSDDGSEWSDDDEHAGAGSRDDDNASDSDSSADSPPVIVNEESVVAFGDRITSEIEILGGTVFPKLDWSAPMDASWMKPEGLKCTAAGEVLLLLKASDNIMHDLTYMLEGLEEEQKDGAGHEFTLCLRQWENIAPANEFRVFVVNGRVVGICQRACDTFFEHMVELDGQVQDAVIEFIEGNLLKECGAWTSSTKPDLVFDIYFQSQPHHPLHRALLVDINPFDPDVTDGLLFSYEEIRSHAKDRNAKPIFRYVDAPTKVRFSKYEASTVPIEAFAISSGHGENIAADLRDAIIESSEKQ